MTCRATPDAQVMVESSDKMWSMGKRNGKRLQHSCLKNLMNSIKRQKDVTLKNELPKSVGVHILLEKSGEIAPEGMKRLSQSRNNPAMDVSGGESKL